MPVVQVGQVGMFVLRRFVDVRVGVHRARWKARMGMVVVKVVVTMGVDVNQRLVKVPMGMASAQHQGDRTQENHDGRRLVP